MAAKKRNKKEKGRKSIAVSLMTFLAVVSLAVYALWSMIAQQTEIAQLRRETEELNEKITVAKQQNDEYTRLLSENDEDAYMEQIAIGRLGYAYPDEKRFYIISGE